MSFAAGYIFKSSGIACIVVNIRVGVKGTTQINSRIDNYFAYSCQLFLSGVSKTLHQSFVMTPSMFAGFSSWCQAWKLRTMFVQGTCLLEIFWLETSILSPMYVPRPLNIHASSAQMGFFSHAYQHRSFVGYALHSLECWWYLVCNECCTCYLLDILSELYNIEWST